MAYQVRVNGSFVGGGNVWRFYSNGTYVTADGRTLSAGWHTVLGAWAAYTYNAGTITSPNWVTDWKKLFDNNVPTVAPAGVSFQKDDTGFLNTNAPFTATAFWSGGVAAQDCRIDFYGPDPASGAPDALLSSVRVNAQQGFAKSDAVYYHGNPGCYAILYFMTDGGQGPAAQTSHITY